MFGTYMVGGLEIHNWLVASVNRTTIFAQVLLYADLAIWLVIAVDGAFTRADSEQRDAIRAAASVASNPRQAEPLTPNVDKLRTRDR
jgi:hypothetical protein